MLRRTLALGAASFSLLIACSRGGAQSMEKDTRMLPAEKPRAGEKEIYLAGGCFWGTEHFMSKVAGVRVSESGYANGTVANPTYEDVCTGRTGAAETVHVIYDPEKADLPFLLGLFFETIDPTSLNRQGNDIGTQYRTGIIYTDPGDKPIIEDEVKKLSAKYSKPLALEVKPLTSFYRAEEYHQDFLVKHPDGYCHIPRRLMEEAEKAKYEPTHKGFRKAGSPSLKDRLTPEQYDVTQNCGTEPPFHNAYWNEHRAGIYVDIVSGEPLFSSSDKFDSGTGWPSFTKPISESVLKNTTDTSYGMVRAEVKSAASGSHLGHVFPDGPSDKGGLRYCMNSASLRFIPKEEMEKEGYGAYLKYVK